VTLAPSDCGVFELRQYAMQPGRRDELIELFEREFVETQEAVGMCVLGTFRDLADADRFVWFRGFRDMDERRQALDAFYDGPVWQEHRNAANATLVDSDDVLLLRPLEPIVVEPPSDTEASVVTAMIGHVAPGDVRREVTEVLLGAVGEGRWSAAFETFHTENTYPRLPIRDDADVLVVLALGEVSPPPEVEHLRLTPTPRSLLR